MRLAPKHRTSLGSALNVTFRTETRNEGAEFDVSPIQGATGLGSNVLHL